MAPQLMVTNGPFARGSTAVELARDELLAGAGLAGDEHADVGAWRPSGACGRPPSSTGTTPMISPKLLVLELGGELLLVGAEGVEEHRVLEDERRLRGEDGEQLELRCARRGASRLSLPT